MLLNNRNFDEVIINPKLIALYAFPKKHLTHKINQKGIRSLFTGVLPITQQNLVQLLPKNTLKSTRVPAFNDLGAKFVKHAAKGLKDNQDQNSFHNRAIHSQIMSLAQNFDYLTNDCVGFFDHGKRYLTAQFNSYDMALTKANLGAMTLSHNINNSGIMKEEIPALVKQAEQHPVDMDFVINHRIEPIYHLVGSKHKYHYQLLLGYHVIEKTNGMAIAFENNRANRILAKKVIQKHAKTYYTAYRKIIKKYVQKHIDVTRA